MCGVDPLLPEEECQGNEIVRVIRGAAEHLPLADHSQDILLMECSLSRFPDPEQALREALRVLKADGMLLVSDMYSRRSDNPAADPAQLEFSAEDPAQSKFQNNGCNDSPETSGRLTVGKLRTVRQIRRMMTGCGFHILEMQDVSHVLGDWIGQMIFDGRSCDIPCLLGTDPAELKKQRCGYFLLAAEPSQMEETLQYAVSRAGWYQDKPIELTGDGEEDLLRFPFCSAADLRRDPYAFLCVSPNQIARIITLQSTGSSGAPKRIFFTEEDLQRTVDFFRWGIRYIVNPGEHVGIFMPGTTHASVGGLLTDAVRAVPAEAETFGLIQNFSKAADLAGRCDVLVGLPSQIFELAARYPGLHPRSVLLSAEFAADSVKRFLRASWGCQVYEHWGMSETGYGGGVECGESGGYHLRDDLRIEIICPETGERVPEGEEGEIVITTTGRTGMPLIRYRTGDIGRLVPDPCGCGYLLPRLGKVRRAEAHCGELSIPRLDEILYEIPGMLSYSAEADKEGTSVRIHILTEEQVSEQKKAQVCASARLALMHTFHIPAEVDTDYQREPVGSAKRRIMVIEKNNSVGKTEGFER